MIRSILESPLVYKVWQGPFVEQKFRPIRDYGLPEGGLRVLDVGCGPGTNARFFAGWDYVGIDLNPGYIAYASARYDGRFEARDVNAGVADLGTFDLVLMNSLMHHLDDTESSRLLAGLTGALTPGGRMHVLDLVMPEAPSVARTLARLDRGDYARPYSNWLKLVSESFHIESHSPYVVGLGGAALWNMVHVVCSRADASR